MTIDEARAAEERAYLAHINALDAATDAWRCGNIDLPRYVAACDTTRSAWQDAMAKLTRGCYIKAVDPTRAAGKVQP